jgi:hypothetical protein
MASVSIEILFSTMEQFLSVSVICMLMSGRNQVMKTALQLALRSPWIKWSGERETEGVTGSARDASNRGAT